MSSPCDRRDFLKRAALAGAGLGALAGELAAQEGPAPQGGGEAPAEPERVPRRPLGKTGETVPILLLGCAQRFDPRYDRVLHRAYRAGVDYLDTALSYANGQSHRTIAPFLKQIGDRGKVWLTSKAPHHNNAATPQTYERDLGTCLEQLETDHLDLFFMHGINDAKYLEPEYIQMGERLKQAGKTRFFGFSCHDGNVVELLEKAARVGGIDAIMFRYSFAQYGHDALNRAIDACHAAGIGLIAMKTMNSVPPELEQVVKFTSKNFSLPQAKLKAVWADERICAAVSHMDNVQKVDENVAAAKSPIRIGRLELRQLRRLADCTAPWACQGCNHLCESRLEGETRVADALRYLMYFECYGQREEARQLYRELSPAQRQLEGVDFSRAVRACPAGIDIPSRLERARQLLA